jgi:tRNA (mo5U34)-methyltransferase
VLKQIRPPETGREEQRMPGMTLEHRLNDLRDVYWHHTLRLGPDLIVNGGKSAEALEAERAAILDPVDLNNRTVIDVGTWNGYFAFEAKRAGARSVTATDSFVWRLPSFRGRDTFELARDYLGLDIAAKEIDPTELPGDLAPADVVLFLGVFYHMFDPILVLRNVAALTRDLLIVETHQDLLEIDRPGMIFYPGKTLNNDGSNWWGPNPACVAELLAELGFARVIYQWHPQIPGRGIYHAFRSVPISERYLRRPADNVKLFDLASPGGRNSVFGSSSIIVRVKELEDQLATAIAGRDAARSEAAALRSALAALHASTSWALTAPFRALSRIVRR